jgi:hypothetical protein
MGVIAAMKQSLAILKNPPVRILTLLLLAILLVLIALGVGFVIGFVIGLINAVLPATVGKVIMAIATSAINSYLGVVMTASFMAFYLGLTSKQEAVQVK